MSTLASLPSASMASRLGDPWLTMNTSFFHFIFFFCFFSLVTFQCKKCFLFCVSECVLFFLLIIRFFIWFFPSFFSNRPFQLAARGIFYRKNSRTQNIRVIIHYINVINITVAAAKPHQPL